jgi:hypothetical protein
MVGDDGFGMVWPDDVPPEIAQAQGRPAEQPAARARPQAAKRALEPVPAAEKPAPAKKSRAKKQPRIAAVETPPERPVLVALPPPPEPRGPRPVPSAKKRPPPPSPRAGTSVGAGKKRELPPYLRVVK